MSVATLPKPLVDWLRPWSVFQAVALMLAIVGCGWANGTLPVYSAAPGQAGPLAGYAGRLVFDDGCMYVLVPGQPDTERVGLVWPSSYKLLLVPPRIEDGAGNLLARAGDLVELTGGFLPNTPLGPCSSGKGPWTVTNIEVTNTFPPP